MHIFSSSPKHAPCANARKRRVVPTDARRGGAGVVGRSRHRPQAHSTQPKRRGVAAAAGGQSDPTDLNINGKRVTSEEAWAMMARTLRDANVRVLSAQEVVFAQQKGVKLIDVRPEDQYDKGHVPDAVNIPFFRPITGWSAGQIVRRMGFAAFGVLNGTEPNPDFMKDAQALLGQPASSAGAATSTSNGGEATASSSSSSSSSSAPSVVLYCNMGGTFEASAASKTGRQTRSMIAAYQLVTKGYRNIAILRGGFAEWSSSGRDIGVVVNE